MSANVCKPKTLPINTIPARLGIHDLPALMAFERQANDDAWSEALLSAALIDDGYDVWGVWSVGGVELRAAAVLAYLPFDAELQSICVLPRERRHGLARELLGWIIRHVTERGAERLLLELRASNVAARKLYESAGFGIDGQRSGYYRQDDGSSEDALLMSRELVEGGAQA